MISPIDILEERVSSAANLIASLRANVALLEKDLASCRSLMAADAPRSSAPDANSDLVSVIEELRAERVLVRERIRALIREIDRVAP